MALKLLALLAWLLPLASPATVWRELKITPLVRRPLPIALGRRPLRPPEIRPWMLPYRGWKDEYRLYFERIAHDPSHVFRPRPTWIVMHYTVSSEAQSVWHSFAMGSRMDTGDYGFVFGHPSVHFIVDRDGAIYQLLPTHWRCTGAYGLNHVALSIEMIAMDEADLLSRPAQVYASLCLVWHLCRQFSIPLERVVSHFEISCGKWVVPAYLDYADSRWPYCYPPAAFRFDPGMTYMGWMRRRLASEARR